MLQMLIGSKRRIRADTMEDLKEAREEDIEEEEDMSGEEEDYLPVLIVAR
jgi:hypothetical protein